MISFSSLFLSLFNFITIFSFLPTRSAGSTSPASARHLSPGGHPWLARRGDCSTVQVQSGNSCASLATECGITAAQFTQYNPSKTLCSTLSPGQDVCCSPGTLPDFAPKPQADGTCATHAVVTDDTCSSIASANSITLTDIGNWYTLSMRTFGVAEKCANASTRGSLGIQKVGNSWVATAFKSAR